MFVKSRLAIAAAVIAGSASMAFAQNYQHDQTPDNTMSYGPRTSTPAPAARTANPAQAPVSSGGASSNYQHDQTPDNTMSYGPRSAR
jgi:hypothetical protein